MSIKKETKNALLKQAYERIKQREENDYQRFQRLADEIQEIIREIILKVPATFNKEQNLLEFFNSLPLGEKTYSECYKGNREISDKNFYGLACYLIGSQFFDKTLLNQNLSRIKDALKWKVENILNPERLKAKSDKITYDCFFFSHIRYSVWESTAEVDWGLGYARIENFFEPRDGVAQVYEGEIQIEPTGVFIDLPHSDSKAKFNKLNLIFEGNNLHQREILAGALITLSSHGPYVSTSEVIFLQRGSADYNTKLKKIERYLRLQRFRFGSYSVSSITDLRIRPDIRRLEGEAYIGLNALENLVGIYLCYCKLAENSWLISRLTFTEDYSIMFETSINPNNSNLNFQYCYPELTYTEGDGVFVILKGYQATRKQQDKRDKANMRYLLTTLFLHVPAKKENRIEGTINTLIWSGNQRIYAGTITLLRLSSDVDFLQPSIVSEDVLQDKLRNLIPTSNALTS